MSLIKFDVSIRIVVNEIWVDAVSFPTFVS
jgi:hypothetical protein